MWTTILNCILISPYLQSNNLQATEFKAHVTWRGRGGVECRCSISYPSNEWSPGRGTNGILQHKWKRPAYFAYFLFLCKFLNLILEGNVLFGWISPVVHFGIYKYECKENFMSNFEDSLENSSLKVANTLYKVFIKVTQIKFKKSK